MKNVLLAAAAMIAVSVAGTAGAAELFATYKQLPNSDRTVQLIDNTSTLGGTLSTIGTPLVDFSYNYQGGLPGALQGDMNAYFNLSATSSSQAWCDTGSATVCTGTHKWQQVFETGTISFILPASAGVGTAPGTNLLTINFQNMTLSGRGGSGSTDAAWDLNLDYGSVLNFSSDFFDFSNLTSSDFALSLSGTLPSIGLGSNGSIASFQANSGGVISTDPVPTYVPEPGMLGLFGAGAFGLAFARRRKS